MAQIKNKHFICLALPAWEAEYLRSTVELMKCLAINNKVLYVDYAYTITDCIKGILGKKKIDWKRMLGFKSRMQKISGGNNNGLYLLTLPPIIPSFVFKNYTLFKFSNKINAAFTSLYINRAAKSLQMQNIISFNSFQPFLGLYWKIKNIDFKIYYCYDDFTNVPYFKGFAKRVESEYIANIDLLLVTSDELKKIKAQANKPVEIVYNGVHFKDFNQYKIANTLKELDPIVVGYTGSIDNRIDIDLLENVIKDLSDIRFLFIGKIFEQSIYQRLSKYNNVEFKPPVPANQIPLVQSKIHIGIIPYIINSLTRAIYPLKANEYLAMGLPVIMTPFASIGEADEKVYIANNANDFKNSILNAISEHNEKLANERIAIAAKADWNIRANDLLEKINFHQKNK